MFYKIKKTMQAIGEMIDNHIAEIVMVIFILSFIDISFDVYFSDVWMEYRAKNSKNIRTGKMCFVAYTKPKHYFALVKINNKVYENARVIGLDSFREKFYEERKKNGDKNLYQFLEEKQCIKIKYLSHKRITFILPSSMEYIYLYDYTSDFQSKF